MQNELIPDASEPSNQDRAKWAMAAVQTFADVTGLDVDVDGLDTAVSDLLADLAHLCDARGLSLCGLLNRAAMHYEDETTNGRQFAALALSDDR